MYYPKVYCDNYILSPKLVSIILYKISNNADGFMYHDTNYVIYLKNTQLKVLSFNTIDQINPHTNISISYSEDWIMIQKFLNKFDDDVALHMQRFLNQYSKELFSIIDAILSLPMNRDIKLIIMSKTFTNLSKITKISTVIDKYPRYFCVYFGDIHKYHFKLTNKGVVIKKLLDHYMITSNIYDNTKIMYVSELYIALMVNNLYSRTEFTILMFENETNKFTIYPLCINVMCTDCYFRERAVNTITNISNSIDFCTVICEPKFTLNVKPLIKKMKHYIQPFMLKLSNTHMYVLDNDLFY